MAIARIEDKGVAAAWTLLMDISHSAVEIVWPHRLSEKFGAVGAPHEGAAAPGDRQRKRQILGREHSLEGALVLALGDAQGGRQGVDHGRHGGPIRLLVPWAGRGVLAERDHERRQIGAAGERVGGVVEAHIGQQPGEWPLDQ